MLSLVHGILLGRSYDGIGTELYDTQFLLLLFLEYIRIMALLPRRVFPCSNLTCAQTTILKAL